MSYKRSLEGLFEPSNFKRAVFFILSDAIIITLSLSLAFYLRFEFHVTPHYRIMLFSALPFFLCIKLLVFAGFRMYKLTWRYVGINDLCNIVGATAVSESVLMVLLIVPTPAFARPFIDTFILGFPRSIFLLDAAGSLILLSALRISKRLYLEIIFRRGFKEGKKTLIVGAGNTGEMIIRDMTRQGMSEFYPVGLIDDNSEKIGTYLHGVKVLGDSSSLEAMILKYAVDAVIIAIPTLNYKKLRELYDIAKGSNVATVKIVPRIYDFHKPAINMKNLEEISIEDLIGRQIVEVDYQGIEAFLKGKTILVTGAGGSIGSEIALQISNFSPNKLILFDIDETEIHNMQIKLKRLLPQLFAVGEKRVELVIGDIRDSGRIKEVFEAMRPEIVFHAAAYKHVPMMEYNAKEAVKVNIFGTMNLADASVKYGVKKFIMISTDKAVRPTSVMGATKRVAEFICTALSGDTAFTSVRFGNVLGSRGSVLPLFMDQLKYGGPLTITHPDMKRYFMTIPEAVSLVLQAGTMGSGGEVLVLDMGEPVRIVELAEDLIKIHGLRPYQDIDIEFVGLRPGEKLFEELFTAEEGMDATRHKKVFVARKTERFKPEEISEMLADFQGSLDKTDDEVRILLKRYVKHYEES